MFYTLLYPSMKHAYNKPCIVYLVGWYQSLSWAQRYVQLVFVISLMPSPGMPTFSQANDLLMVSDLGERFWDMKAFHFLNVGEVSILPE